MWEGVLHVVPAPLTRHQQIGTELLVALVPAARARGLVALYETQLYQAGFADENYRVPDLLFSAPERRTRRGIEGSAELVVEIRSPRDESYEKLDFYIALGCAEILYIDRDLLTLELWVGGRKQLQAEAYDLASLGVRIERIDMRSLAVTWQGETTVITPFSG